MLKNIWRFIKVIISKLLSLFRHKEVAIIREEPQRDSVSWRNPNMPKFQPCPRGHGWKKRIEKTIGGARYLCNRCRDKFFVAA